MKALGCYFKWLNDYVGTIVATATIGLFVSIIDNRIMSIRYKDHMIYSEQFFKEQQLTNASFLRVAESIEELKKNGSVAIRDYVDYKAKEVEQRVNTRLSDDKELTRRLEREFRIVQSRLGKFNLYLEKNDITLGEKKNER